MTDPLNIEQTLNRLQHHKGVIGVLVLNNDGAVLKSNLDNTQTVQYTNALMALATLARSVVRDLDPENDLQILRIRTKKHEVLVSPAKTYLLVVIQNPEDN